MIGALALTTSSVRSPPTNSYISTSKTRSIKSAFRDVVDAKPLVDRSPYEVLRVERNATAREIKTAYRSLAKIYHPDCKQQGGEGDFVEIHNAYATLSDPATRASYDMKWTSGSRLCYTVVGQRQGFYTCRRWETDQCW